MRLRSVLLFLALAPATIFAQAGSQVAATPGTLPKTIDRKAVRIDQNLGGQVPLDASFKDQTGKAVTFGEALGGKPAVVMCIFYLCRGVCNLELQSTIATVKQMKAQKLGKDFDVIVVGIHPKEGSDLAQGKFKSTIDEVNLPGTEGGWRFLTGDWANIHKVTDALGFHYTYDPQKDAIDHPSGVMFLSPQGKISSYVYGANYSAAIFDRNLDLASRAKVGAKAEEIFFGCIHVDPLTGKRSLVIQNVLKVAGIGTVLAIALSIAVLSGKASFRRRRTS